MIISNLTGGLGNQMFQYALGRHLATKNKTELKLHFTNALFCTQRSFALDCFNIKAKPATDEDLKRFGIIKNRVLNRIFYLLDERLKIQFNKKIYTQKYPYRFDPSVLQLKDNVYLQGFWQDERYFKDIKDILLQDFTLKKGLNKKVKQLESFIKTTESVSIHVRRGDFVRYSPDKILSADYYLNEVNKIKKKLKNPVFFIFSDDIDWCNKNIYPEKHKYFVTGNEPCEDLILMSLCKHNIIANSSFSWWGKWLNKYE